MISLVISATAFCLAILRVEGLAPVRYGAVFLALGSGQIHIAVLSFSALLFADQGYRFPPRIDRRSALALGLIVITTLLVTLSSTVYGRTFSELAQLLLYVILFFQLQSMLKRPGTLPLIMKCSVWAAALVAIMGLAAHRVGMTQLPHIFIARGGNEGSTFLLLMGVVPALALFLQSRKWIYVVIVVILFYAQLIATSRANMAMTMLAFAGLGFFVWQTLWIRVGIFIGLLGAIYLNFSVAQSALDEQLNYSVLQRLSLYQAGWDLWLARPLTGWGWGSTSVLAPQTALTDDSFPHFHSTYIQFLVELGIFGLALVTFWLVSSLRLIFRSAFGSWPKDTAFYISMSSVMVLLSGLTEAMLFGADRAVQIVIVFAVMQYMLRSAAATTTSGNAANIPLETPPAGLSTKGSASHARG